MCRCKEMNAMSFAKLMALCCFFSTKNWVPNFRVSTLFNCWWVVLNLSQLNDLTVLMIVKKGILTSMNVFRIMVLCLSPLYNFSLTTGVDLVQSFSWMSLTFKWLSRKDFGLQRVWVELWPFVCFSTKEYNIIIVPIF